MTFSVVSTNVLAEANNTSLQSNNMQTYEELYNAFETKNDITIDQNILIKNNGDKYLKVTKRHTIHLDINNKTISNALQQSY